MKVETYECAETAAEPIEACEEAVRIINDLGLEGQGQLVSERAEAPVRRCPYREMKKDEAFVFGVLCPDKVSLKEYDSSPVPLRVLQIAAHATSLDIYADLQVWYVAGEPGPDPVLIGLIGGEYEWSVKARHLLARWGEELESWPTLVDRAMRTKRTALKDVCRTLAIKLAEGRMIDEMTDKEIMEKGSGWWPTADF